jgi:TolB protein
MNLKRILPLLLALALLALPSLASAAPAGSTFLVSRPDGTGPLPTLSDNDSFGRLAVSDDGRYVAFLSQADGFAPGADPRFLNLFVRDTVTNTTTLASRSDGLNGAGVNADVSTVERAQIGIAVMSGSQLVDAPHDRPHVLVAFSTKATNLVDHLDGAAPSRGLEAVWMRDVTAGTTYLVSRASTVAGAPAGAPADGPSFQPSIAPGPNGPIVAFASRSTNLELSGPTPAVTSVYLREVEEGATQAVSCSSRPCNPEGPSFEPSLRFVDSVGVQGPEMCPMGERCAVVAFTTADPLLLVDATAPPDNAQIVAARARVRADGTGLLRFDQRAIGSTVWLQPTTLGNGPSRSPSLSPNGDGVAFVSQATNLDPFGPPVPPGSTQAYFHSLGAPFPTGVVSVSKDSTGVSFAQSSSVEEVSVGGPVQSRRFGFSTAATNLGFPSIGVPRAYQVLPVTEPASLLDRAAGASGAIGNGRSGEVALSADGSTAVFVSDSGNLGAGGGADFERVYRRRIDPGASGFGSLQLVSRPSGTAAFSAGSKRARIPHSAISTDGRYVAFESNADDLSAADDDSLVNVFVRDTVNGTTTLVSRAGGAAGAAADESSRLNGISENGQRVLFTTTAQNLGAGQSGEHAYVRDLAAQTTTLVTRVNGPTGAVASGDGMSISGDGNRVAFRATRPLDPDAGQGSHLYVRDLAAQTTILADRENGINGRAADAGPIDASLDRDGSRVAWTTSASLRLPGQVAVHLPRVYVRDLVAGTTVLASRADGADGAEADRASSAPALNAAGDVVAFESEAINLGTSVNERSIWIRRLTTGRTELVSRANGPSGGPANEPSFGASIDASGERIAFTTHANNFGANPNEEGPPTPGSPAYVRDMKAKTTELVSRVNGVNGPRAEPAGGGGVSISASGDCVAFSGTGANYTDAYASADFELVRERVLRGSCGPSSIPSAGVAEPPAAAPLPMLSRLQMRPARFFVGGPEGGARISFQLSAASPVTLAFDRLVRGARASRLVTRRVGRITVQGQAGANTIRFSGRVRGRALRPGRYRWTATPQQGAPSSGRFVVLKRPQT